MADLTMEKPLMKELMSMADEMDQDSTCTEMTSRIGTMTLHNGLEAQIHVTITTEVDDFLEPS